MLCAQNYHRDFYRDELEFKEKLKYDPDNYDLHYDLAMAYLMQGKYSQALKEYKQVVFLNENDSDALARLGYIFRMNRKFQLAENNLKKAVSINPNDGYAWKELAFVQSDLCRSSEAIESLKKSLSCDNSLENARFVLFYIAVLQLNLHQKDEALKSATQLETYDADLAKQIREMASMQ